MQFNPYKCPECGCEAYGIDESVPCLAQLRSIAAAMLSTSAKARCTGMAKLQMRMAWAT